MEKENVTALSKARFDIKDCKATMKAIVTTGIGGYEKLNYRDVPLPKLTSNEVLLQVIAAGVNNTEINVRRSWYSSTASMSTEVPANGEKEKRAAKKRKVVAGMRRHHFHSFRVQIVVVV